MDAYRAAITWFATAGLLSFGIAKLIILPAAATISVVCLWNARTLYVG